jgi:hypothetical protein
MMKHVKTTMIASAIALSLGTANVLADSWTITQEFTLSNTATQSIIQNGGTTNSVQAINNINLDGSGRTVNDSSSQTLTIDTDITLDQDAAGNNNIQAINNALVNTVNGLTQTLQPDTAAQTVKLEQGFSGTTGTGNDQAVNRVKGTTITKLNQSITGTITLDLDQANGVENNVQAGNLIDASTTGTTVNSAGTANLVIQDINIDTLDMLQDGSDYSIQAGNALITASVATGGTIKQTITDDTLAMTQQGGADGSIQSGNYVGDRIATTP